MVPHLDNADSILFLLIQSFEKEGTILFVLYARCARTQQLKV